MNLKVTGILLPSVPQLSNTSIVAFQLAAHLVALRLLAWFNFFPGCLFCLFLIQKRNTLFLFFSISLDTPGLLVILFVERSQVDNQLAGVT